MNSLELFNNAEKLGYVVEQCDDWQMSPIVRVNDYMLLQPIKDNKVLENGIYCFYMGGFQVVRRVKKIFKNSFLGYSDGGKNEQEFFFDNIKNLSLVAMTRHLYKKHNPNWGFEFVGKTYKR